MRAQNNGGSVSTVQGDVNGDGIAAFEFVVTVTDGDPIAANNFIV